MQFRITGGRQIHDALGFMGKALGLMQERNGHEAARAKTDKGDAVVPGPSFKMTDDINAYRGQQGGRKAGAKGWPECYFPCLPHLNPVRAF